MQCEMSLSWTKASNHFVGMVPSLPEEKGVFLRAGERLAGCTAAPLQEPAALLPQEPQRQSATPPQAPLWPLPQPGTPSPQWSVCRPDPQWECADCFA